MAENLQKRVMAEKKRNYKWCFVPSCTQNNICSPSTIFLSVPKGEIRRKWFEISGRTDASTISLTSSLFCCEHHFNLEEDVENYMQVRFIPNVLIRLKNGVMPTKFACQPHRETSDASNINVINIDRPSTSKRTFEFDDRCITADASP
ncbi:uncharacterized protein [Mycetomoellerius zeteki]|uniref:uncharacterized protein n=1 Tax=Mycetomoellerius zeteki TaxID=64791 RepID=UPI00084E48C0|nr:PREDICTED: uncharacterized protein LOC108730156 [Trachymyrmex zeteki]XP_018317255.1 PREDICTED: uncharacterized protein LOC108731420 [Trachymyrmex zeteki]